MPSQQLPDFPYGAVYFRKSNPPAQDWERDYATAAEDGHNTFRHWFLWSAIETEPGVFNWSEYDRQLDLAAQNGMKTIIAEMITATPEWAYYKYPHARFEIVNGQKVHPTISGSCITGGFPGLCLDNDDFKALAENFLRKLVERYQDHPGLGGYDIWNECNIRHDICYCQGTAEKFRSWLKNKYGDVKTLADAWFRHSLSEWEYVTPPRQLGPYPDSLDWLQFRIDNAYALMRWRADIIKSLDQVHPVVAHGIAASLTRMAPGAADDWRAASEVSVYGYTWGSSRHGDESWKQVHAVDLVRAASRGKPFWHAETYAGPLWMQPQVIDKPRNEGRIATPEDIRYWDLVSFMAGATGMMYLRWRPLLDGPLFGAFGPYGMDGSRTPRSAMVSKIAHWVNAEAQKSLWKSKPVKGEVGIVFIPETQIFTYAQQHNTDFYTRSMQGAYRGFFDNNIQADWVHINHIDEYDFLYVPFPIMMNESTARRLIAWVESGGKLVMEGCPGYFGDKGHVGVVQPNFGMDNLFGVRESYVEFAPDISDNVRMNFSGTSAWGGIFIQAYTVTSGRIRAFYEAIDSMASGQVASVENHSGKGHTLLLGSMAGYGHGTHSSGPGDEISRPVECGGSPQFFRILLNWAGKKQHVSVSDPHIIARIHTGVGGTYLWVANPTHHQRQVSLCVNAIWGEFSSCKVLWGSHAEIGAQNIILNSAPRDVSVIALA